MDKTQRRIMMVVPLIFITVIAHFPVGLVIYWVTTNLWTVGQGLITRRLVPTHAAPRSCRPARSGARAPRPPPTAAGERRQTAPPPQAAPKPRTAPAQPRRVKRNRGHGRR